MDNKVDNPMRPALTIIVFAVSLLVMIVSAHGFANGLSLRRNGNRAPAWVEASSLFANRGRSSSRVRFTTADGQVIVREMPFWRRSSISHMPVRIFYDPSNPQYGNIILNSSFGLSFRAWVMLFSGLWVLTCIRRFFEYKSKRTKLSQNLQH